MEKIDVGHQVPKPPAPEPGVPPGNIPPLPPDIPVPDPPPPPVENPGDVPLRPITDPDVIEPSEPTPVRTPMHMRGVKRGPEGSTARSSARNAGADSRNERSNLFKSSALQHDGGELGDKSNTDGTKPSASANDLNPQNWSGYMMSVKPEDFAADFAALRDDVTKLTSSVSEFIRKQTATASNTVFDATDNARQRISDTASKAQDRVAGASRDLETTIEHNPLAAVLIAMVAGLFIGVFGGSLNRK